MATAYKFDPVQDEIHARIDQLERDFAKLSIGELCRRVDALRSLARRSGFGAVAELATGFRDELARAGRAAMIRPYIASLRDASGCDPADSKAGDIYLASVSVRLG